MSWRRRWWTAGGEANWWDDVRLASYVQNGAKQQNCTPFISGKESMSQELQVFVLAGSRCCEDVVLLSEL